VTVAGLYDIHGNLPALEAVLGEVPDEALIVIGGDFVGGPWPRETMDRLRELGDRCRWLRGNADREAAADVQVGMSEEARRSLEWSAKQLRPEQRSFIRSLPNDVVLDVDGLGPTLFCHGSPRSDEEIITAVTSDSRLAEILAGVEQQTVVCGHTHHQFDRTVDRRRVVNAGSVGMAYEGEQGAYWALLGPEVELRRTKFDVDGMLAAMAETNYPEAANLTEILRDDIPTAAWVADYFERQALAQEAS
jgi:predicted phosphodiesterase